jgi:hypothetical protein
MSCWLARGDDICRSCEPRRGRQRNFFGGRVRLCGGGSGPHVEPGQCPSISFNCKRRASQVQLVHLLLELSSLTGASSLLDVPCWWTGDVPREAVDVSREGRCISVHTRSCPALLGGGPTWDLHLRELLGLAGNVGCRHVGQRVKTTDIFYVGDMSADMSANMSADMSPTSPKNMSITDH